MKLADINIRDPYVLLHEGKYYLYGTRGATCWGEADGFDAYVSDDLENWSILHISDLHGQQVGSGQSAIRKALKELLA